MILSKLVLVFFSLKGWERIIDLTADNQEVLKDLLIYLNLVVILPLALIIFVIHLMISKANKKIITYKTAVKEGIKTVCVLYLAIGAVMAYKSHGLYITLLLAIGFLVKYIRGNHENIMAAEEVNQASI